MINKNSSAKKILIFLCLHSEMKNKNEKESQTKNSPMRSV